MTGTTTHSETGLPAPVPASVLRSRGFLALLGSRTASTVATSVTWVLLPLHVYDTTGSATLAGLMSAMNVVPFIVFGLLAGVMADRSSPRNVMIAMEVGNAAALLIVPILTVTGSLSVWSMLAVGALSSTLYVWFDVASSTIVPAVVGRARVFQANGHLWSVATLVSATAAPFGFFLLSRRGLGGAFAILAGFSLLSAVLISRVQRIVDDPPPAAERATTGAQIVEGLRFMAREPTVRMLTLVAVGSGLSGGAVYGMIVVFADKALGLRPDDTRLAWIIAASSVGAFIASFLGPRLRRFRITRVVVALLVADVVLMTGYARSSSWLLALAAVAAWNIAHTSLMIVSISVRQVLTPAHLQGRVNAAGRIIAWGTVPLGTGICGVLVDATGSGRTATLMLVVPVTLSLVVALVLARRAAREQREIRC